MCLTPFTLFFFFQAEDGIRDSSVTGVQTCALPISKPDLEFLRRKNSKPGFVARLRSPERTRDLCDEHCAAEIGRASCTEREWTSGCGVAIKKNTRSEKRRTRARG